MFEYLINLIKKPLQLRFTIYSSVLNPVVRPGS